VSEGDRSGVPPSESCEATDRPIPVAGSRTSPHEVGLPFREIAEPGSGLLVARAPPALCARTRRTPGSFPVRLPETPKSSGPSHGLRPLYRVSDRSLRPTRLRVDSSHGVLRPYDDFRSQIRFTRACLTRHLPASGFGYPLAGLLPAHGSDPEIGHRPWGSPFRASYLPASRTRYRAVVLMPFPAHPSFSSEDEKVGSSAATPGLCSNRKAVPFREVVPPFRAVPSWVSTLSEALAPRAGSGFPDPPLMCFLVGSGRSRRRRRHSRVSNAARSGGLSRVHRLP
jgi:hypothetical protein